MADDDENDLQNLIQAVLQQGPAPNLDDVLPGPMQGDPIQVGLDTLEQGVPALAHLIQQHHPRNLIFNTANMTLFQRLTRALIEFFCRNNRRPYIYGDLTELCHGQVTPHSVSLIAPEDLVGMGVAGQPKARGIRNLALTYMLENADDLNQLEPHAAYADLKGIAQVGPKAAFYMTIFGLRNVNHFPSRELDFRKKLGRFSPLYNNRYPSEEEAHNDYMEWVPFRGLGAFLIWWYS